MNTGTLPRLTALDHELSLDPNDFGMFRSSHDLLDDPAALQRRLKTDGYLYVPGFFEREDILSVRTEFISRLAAEGLLAGDVPSTDAVWNPKQQRTTFKSDLGVDNPLLDSVVFGPQLLGFYEALFREPVMHFDYKWVRAVGPGTGTNPHCDVVYMGRGTHDLLTCWIPYGDVPLELGGLILLENSHLQSNRLRSYLNVDVDSYCENRPSDVVKVKENGGWSHPGALTTNPASLQAKLGGRWLTARWQAGDFITFRIDMVHGSLDNQTDRIRLSSDTRYQKAGEPADPRWIGPNPIAHGTAGKRGRIC